MEYKYEGHSLKSGIYKLTNKINGRIYIGSTKCFKTRWKSHEYSLRMNNHGNKFLQADYNKSGSDAFEFSILEVVCDKAERIKREDFFLLKYYDKQNKCYNLCHVAFTPEGTFSKDSEERKAKRSKAFKNTWSNPINRENMVKNMKKRAAEPNFKKKRSEFAKAQWRRTEDRNKILNAIKNKKNTNTKTFFFISPNGEEHRITNIMEFATKMNLDYRALYEINSGKAESHKGWRNGNKYQGSFDKVLHRSITHTTEKYKNISIISNNGDILTGTLPEVARKAGLVAKSLSAVIRGDKKTLHGWKLYK